MLLHLECWLILVGVPLSKMGMLGIFSYITSDCYWTCYQGKKNFKELIKEGFFTRSV